MSDVDYLKSFLSSKRFDTEHALNVYVRHYLILPASEIYNDEMLADKAELISNCHIYFIGLVPDIQDVDVSLSGTELCFKFLISDDEYVVAMEVPPDTEFLQREGDGWILTNSSGGRFWPRMDRVLQRLSAICEHQAFKVLYIGQAYGADGSRNAIDRLLNHGTLQKISLQGIPAGYRLMLMLLDVAPGNRLITMINPFAQEQDPNLSRIEQGLDFLATTTEAERTTLFEASFIRYFQPKFNKVFKDSFPSTNMSVLTGCYSKDIAAVVAEINHDELPFKLYSDTVEAAYDHTAHHDLHKDEDRRVFFGLNVTERSG